MSNRASHGGGGGDQNRPRPVVRYNLAALRLAQSSNEETGPQIHYVTRDSLSSSTVPPNPKMVAGGQQASSSRPLPRSANLRQSGSLTITGTGGEGGDAMLSLLSGLRLAGSSPNPPTDFRDAPMPTHMLPGGAPVMAPEPSPRAALMSNTSVAPSAQGPHGAFTEYSAPAGLRQPSFTQRPPPPSEVGMTPPPLPTRAFNPAMQQVRHQQQLQQTPPAQAQRYSSGSGYTSRYTANTSPPQQSQPQLQQWMMGDVSQGMGGPAPSSVPYPQLHTQQQQQASAAMMNGGLAGGNTGVPLPVPLPASQRRVMEGQPPRGLAESPAAVGGPFAGLPRAVPVSMMGRPANARVPPAAVGATPPAMPGDPHPDHAQDLTQMLQSMGIHASVAERGPSAPPQPNGTGAGHAPPPMSMPPGHPAPMAAVPPSAAPKREEQRAPLNFYQDAAAAQRGPGSQGRRPPPPPQNANGRRGSKAAHGPSPPPARAPRQAPAALLGDSDPEMVARFEREYARQEDLDIVDEELRAQQLTQAGTVGTLDVDVCLATIEANDVTFVVTDTGTGKSTRIPMGLYKVHPDALIVNAQPRRTAAINLAQRVASVLEVQLGEEVGYSVRGEHIGELGETKVMYVTTYSLFTFLLWQQFKEKLPFSYIIMDEFHERTPDVEVMLLMMKLWLQRHPGAFKLVLCSATVQVEEWHSFFDGFRVGTYARSAVMFPIQEYYMEDLQRLSGIRAAPIVPQDANNNVAQEQMHQLILVCKQLLVYLGKHTATQDSVLVFMPGRTQVELMVTWIRDNLEESFEPVAWYRDIDLSVIQEALARPAVTRKKVYVATDIAEVSLTLKDVVFIIDSGTGKRPQISKKEPTSYAFPPLRLLWETASNAQQRRGRVGRVKQGFYFSLLTREHQLSLRSAENRMKNAVLTELVLHSLLLTQKPFAFFQLCNERPEGAALAHSLHLLQDSGLIIAADSPVAEAERVALDRGRTTHVKDSPWNALIEEAIAAAAPEAVKENGLAPVTTTATATGAAEEAAAADEPDKGSATEGEDTTADSVGMASAEESAFQQRYFVTMRGVIAARAPVSVSAATNIFFGLVFGMPTLTMLASAIESCKSPFHVPYTINDRMERAGMVRAVSTKMQSYHGELRSDLVCAMAVVLEYMSMQRDGLSEEAQDEWCQERCVSRTRIVDTLNLFAQMKEQVGSVLPFPDVTDIDALTAQFERHAELLVLMLVASHTELAIHVQLDGPVAQRQGFVGHGVFFPLKCLKDESVPTVCPWDRTKISVPLSLQTIQRRVLAVFATQVEPDLFALVVLVFSFELRYTVHEDATTPHYLMTVSHSGIVRTFQCDVLTAQLILQLRRIQCAQLCCMQLQVEERVRANESEKLSAALAAVKTDFGIPEAAIKTPFLIPTVLQQGLKQLINRLREAPAFKVSKCTITAFPPGAPFCKLIPHVQLATPVLASALVHCSNGLSVVQPAAEPVNLITNAAATATVAAAAADDGGPTATPTASRAGARTKAREVSVGVAEEEASDRSSDSGSEIHVATFRYDL